MSIDETKHKIYLGKYIITQDMSSVPYLLGSSS